MDYETLAPSVPSGKTSVTLDTAVFPIFVVAEEVRETSEQRVNETKPQSCGTVVVASAFCCR